MTADRDGFESALDSGRRVIRDARPEVSVVVCSRDGARTLPVTLAALRCQTIDPGRFEVVVVDDGSSDETAAIARAAGAEVVRLSPSQGLAAARNAGVAAARTPLVAFTDDDCEPTPSWLAEVLEAMSPPGVDGVGGWVQPACDSAFRRRFLQDVNPLTPLAGDLLRSRAPLYRLMLYLRGICGLAPRLQDGAELYAVVGANMTLRRALLDALGGFDPAIRFGGEEEELCMRARRLRPAARLRYAERAVVIHHFPPSPVDGLRRARAYGRGHRQTARRHPEVRAIVYPVPALGLLAALATAFGKGRERRRWWPALSLIAYPRFVIACGRRRSLEPLLYGPLQLAEEVATMLGEWER